MFQDSKRNSLAPANSCPTFLGALLTAFLLFIAGPFPLKGAAHGGTPDKGISIMEAVAAALDNSPDILLKRQDIRFSRGALQQAGGEFDPGVTVKSSYQNQDTPLSESIHRKVRTSSHAFELRKQLRNGLSMGASADLTQTNPDGDSGGVSQPTQNTAGVYFSLTVPLLRGLGREVAAAGELAARVNLEITELQTRDTVSRIVLDTALAYWRYRAAYEALNQRTGAEERAKESLRITRAMIEADELPSSLMENARAKLSSKRASRILARQALYEAKLALGRVMGIGFDHMETLPLPSDPLPDGTPDTVENLDLHGDRLIALSPARRHDHQALQKSIDYSRILLTEARDNLLPQLDLTFSLGYSGWDGGSDLGSTFSPLVKNVPGASGGISLNYSFPVPNNNARGALLGRRANLQKYRIQLGNSARIIRSNVAGQLFALKQRLLQLREVDESVRYYGKAVGNAQKKFQLGMATLSDLLQVKDDLDLAVSQKINVRRQYAEALAGLRRQTATLVRFSGCAGRIEPADLVSAPGIPE